MRRSGFTLVEVLVVVAIAGLLVALLLPAIQAARESARLGVCKNNLRQIGLAVLLHCDQQGNFPYGGWGHEWVGIPDRGFRKRQPGGWIYNTLPYMEQGALHALSGTDGSTKRLSTPLSLFTCPSRRPCRLWPISSLFEYMRTPRPCGTADDVPRGDYAINSGTTLTINHIGPVSLEAGDSGTHPWPNMSGFGTEIARFSGLSHVHAAARPHNLTDGASVTYLAGEKYLDPSQYENGEARGDNESLFSGYASDNHRFASIDAPPLTPSQDGALALSPRDSYRFGSPHAVGAQFVNCDGSVQLVTFDVSAEIHYRSAHVSDEGGPLP